jgi:urease accessory protein
MQRATSVIRKPAVKAEKVIDTVVLDHEGRHRRRVTLAGQGGTSFLLDLDKATVLNDGDALKLDDGTLIAVKAADQSLIEISAATPKRLMRIAWHIGNRHTPAEIGEEAVWIEPDHVLVEMVRGLGGQTRPMVRPFQPERGAYEAAEAHGHGHAHDHGHDHAHDHAAHGHAGHDNPAHGQPGHVHGPGCGHDHSHDHGHAHDQRHGHDHGHAHDEGHSHGHGHKHG